MNTPTLFDWQAERDSAMATVERNAGADFAERARAHVLAALREVGSASGEEIVNHGENKGITAHTARAWGPIFGALSRQKLIVKAGYCQRLKGHGTCGGIVWKLA
jgi:hypothetical protein